MKKFIQSSMGKYTLLTILGYLTLILPVLIYNAIEWEAFKEISAYKLSFTFVVAACAVMVAVMTKMKHKGWLLFIITGLLLVVLGELGTQLGWSILIIGGSLIIETFAIRPFALKYKILWYKEQGRDVTFTKTID